MRIAFIPRYTRHAASTRLRCYAIAEAINRHEMGEAEICPNGERFAPLWPKPDVVILQKAVDPLLMVNVLVMTAGKVVYDADDLVEATTRTHIQHYCHAVTTDTEPRAAGIREWFHGPVHVIPDPIDYEDGPPKPPNPEGRGLVWFGNYPNFESVRAEMAHYLRGGERCGAISDLTPARANMPGLELIPWAYDTFPGELRKWDRCVLSHRGADPCKSENKLVAAIYQGVFPAYVCGPAYEALVAKLVGLSDAAAQAFVYENYRADVIARKAMEVYEGL